MKSSGLGTDLHVKETHDTYSIFLFSELTLGTENSNGASIPTRD